jgi:DNA-binding winged helix-turn-helix (wHTH) protein
MTIALFVKNSFLIEYLEGQFKAQGISTTRLNKENILDTITKCDTKGIIIEITSNSMYYINLCKNIDNISSELDIYVIYHGLDDDFIQTLYRSGVKHLVISTPTLIINDIIKETNVLSIGKQLHIDTKKQNVIVNGETIPLTRTEFNLLTLFYKKRNQLITTNEILEKNWGDTNYCRNQVYIYIYRLRKKIETDFKKPKYLVGKKRNGYILITEKYS